MPGRTGRRSQTHNEGTKIMNGHSSKVNKNGLNSIETEIQKQQQPTENSSPLLDESLVKELMTLAENVVSGQINSMVKEEEDEELKQKKVDDDDDIQVITESVKSNKQRKRVLPLKLPAEFQIKIRDHLKAKGKTVDQVDLLNITSEVCKQTMEKIGVGITNCSLRVWSSHTNNSTNNSNNNRNSTKQTERASIDNNKVKDEPSPNIGNVVQPLQKTTSQEKRSDQNLNHQNSYVNRRSVGRPRKHLMEKKLRQPKAKRMKVSRKLVQEHSVKAWPYQGPVSSSNPPVLNKVKKRPKLKGPHRENVTTKFLRRVIFNAEKSGFVTPRVFNELYSKYDKNPINELLDFFHSLNLNPNNEFVFKKWSITHLSTRSVSEIFRALKAPQSIIKSFDQLSQTCSLPMIKVDPEAYRKTHLSQLSKNEFCDLFALGPCPTRVSQRSKQPTQKFQDSPCSSSMPNLVSSINSTPSPPKISLSPISTLLAEQKPNEKLDKARDSLRIAMKCKRKIKPKYRFLFPKREKVCKIEEEPNEGFMELDQLIQEVAADVDEMEVIEEDVDAASVIDVTEMSSRLCDFDMDLIKLLEEKEVKQRPSIQKNSLAVRKFPSYGWSREREARIKATITEENSSSGSKTRSVSCPPTTQLSVDFPRFELSGLSETAPKEIEGWFVSKIKLLRKLSEPSDLDSANRKSPLSRSGSIKRASNFSPSTSTSAVGVTKVSVSVALDQDVSIINDLPEYLKELQRLNHIIDQIEEENDEQQNNDNDEDLNEALKTAKKIEKASVSGLVRQVSLPSLHCYLPPGWHCRKTCENEGWIYVNSEGVKVKSIRAAMRYEAIKSSEKERRQRKMTS